MAIQESFDYPDNLHPLQFQIGQEVFDKDGKRLGKVRARFNSYILVERNKLFGKPYYVPHSTVVSNEKNTIRLSLSEEDLRLMGYTSVPDDLYIETPEPGIPNYSGVAQFAKGPLSPAETGHYNYGAHWPGMNTDASGSYHRDEVMPKPQQYVRDKVFETETPIEPRTISPD